MLTSDSPLWHISRLTILQSSHRAVQLVCSWELLKGNKAACLRTEKCYDVHMQLLHPPYDPHVW